MQIQAMTPKPSSGEVIELNMSVIDPTTGVAQASGSANTMQFDSLVCG